VEQVFKSVGIVARYDKKAALKLAEELAEFLKGKDLEVYIEDSLAGKIKPKGKFVPLSNMHTDFIIIIGGDGTILRTSVNAPKPEPPFLAINMGVRGFLTEVEPQKAREAVERILGGDYKVERCAKLAVKADEGAIPDALNDVVISAGEPSKILYSRIFKDGRPILRSHADGLIIATQTGSTAYSLSAGGPVLDREVDAFLITPICSLSVFRSLVVPADSTITINVIRPGSVLVLVDGRYHKLMSAKEPMIQVTRSKNVSSFIRFETDFYDRLRNRLLFKGTE
jgi:NAD+ kinase